MGDFFTKLQALKNGTSEPDPPKEKKWMPKRSKKLSKEMRKYKPEMIKFLEANPLCMAGLQGCNITADSVHHQKGRLGKLLHDKKHFLAVCQSCHRMIHDQENLAKETGLSKSRLNKTA